MTKFTVIAGCALLSFVFWIGIIVTIFDAYPNECEMTYMFEYPVYVKINVKNNTFQNYNLFVYGEGDYASDLQRKIYNGIPVLFIPGNQGSYKQVRSLASVAYQMARYKGYAFHFDFFSVDFDEEMSALYGASLNNQAEFVLKAMKTIMRLYRKSKPNLKSIILIAHSIGGILARSLPSSPNSFEVSLIVTLATPHARPVLVLDREIDNFYKSVDDFWKYERSDKLRNVVFVTIGNGRNDILVPSLLTRSDFADVDVSLTSVPLCWLTTDHRAIVWCKQLVLAVVRALFASINQETLQIYQNKDIVREAFKHHLIERRESSDVPSEKSISVALRESVNIHEVTENIYSSHISKSSTPTFVTVPLERYRPLGHLTLITGPIGGSKIFFFSCQFDSKNSSQPLSLVSLMQHVHSTPGGLKLIAMDMKSIDYSVATHLMLYMQSKNDMVVEVELKPFSSMLSINAPLFLSFSPVNIADSYPASSLLLNFTVNNFTEFWQSFLLRLESTDSCHSTFQPIVSYETSWMKGRSYPLKYRNSLGEYILELDSPANSSSDYVLVSVVKNSYCHLNLSLQMNHMGVFQRISLLYAPHIPAFLASHILLWLSTLLKDDSSITSSSFGHISLSPLRVLPFIKLISYILPFISNIETDVAYVYRHRMSIQAEHLIIYLSSFPLALVLLISIRLIIVLYANILQFYIIRHFPSVYGSNDEDNGRGDRSLWKYAVLITVSAILAITFSFSSSFALFVAFIFYFLKVIKDRLVVLNYNEHPPNSNQFQNSEESVERRRSFEIHLLFLLLLLICSLLNVPPLLSWIKNYRFEPVYLTDSASMSIAVILFSVVLMWHFDKFSSKCIYDQITAYLIHFAAIGILLFGSIRIYRIPDFIASVLFAVSLKQTFNQQ